MSDLTVLDNNIPAHIRRNVPSERSKAITSGFESREVPIITRTLNGRIKLRIPGRDPIQTLPSGQAITTLDIIVLDANPGMPRAYYDPNDRDVEEGKPPLCASIDGVYPRKGVQKKQSQTCALCPNAVWGTGYKGQGTACAQQKHLAVRLAGEKNTTVFFLKLTPTDLNKKAVGGFPATARDIEAKGFNVEDVILTLGLSQEANHAKWHFAPKGFVTEAVALQNEKIWESGTCRTILGLDTAESDVPSEAAVARAATPPAPQAQPAPQPAQAQPQAQSAVDKGYATRQPVPGAAIPKEPEAEVVDTMDDLFGGSEEPAPEPPQQAAARTVKPAKSDDEYSDLIAEFDL